MAICSMKSPKRNHAPLGCMSLQRSPNKAASDRGKLLEVRGKGASVTRQFSSTASRAFSQLSGDRFPISCNISTRASEFEREPDLSPSLIALRVDYSGPPARRIAQRVALGTSVESEEAEAETPTNARRGGSCRLACRKR